MVSFIFYREKYLADPHPVFTEVKYTFPLISAGFGMLRCKFVNKLHKNK